MRRAATWAILSALLLAACGAGIPDKGRIEAGPGEPLRVGVVTELSGPLAAEGQGIAQGARLAAEQFRSVRGHAVAIELVDGGCDAGEAEAAVTPLLPDPQVVGVVGPVCSPGCLAAAAVLHTPAVAMVTPRCTDIAVTHQGYGNVFRTAWTDAAEAVGAVEFATDHLRVRRVFLISDGTVYGRNMRDVFKLFFGKSKLAGNEQVLTGTEDYGPVVRAIEKSSAGMVYYAGFAEDAARFVAQLRAAGVTLPVMAPDAVKDEQAFIAAAGGAAEGVYVSEAVPERGRTYDAFAAAYRRQFGADPGPYAGEGYDAMMVLLRAVERTARRRGDRLVVDRRALFASLVQTDLRGATGRIRFRLNGDRIEGVAVRVLRVRDGRFVEDAVIHFDDD